MTDITVYKKQLKESITNGIAAGLGISEKTDTPVGAKAGMMIAAGPAKVGDAITKMDDATFQIFAQKIDSAGIDMVMKTFTVAGAPPTTPNTVPTDPATPQVAPASPAPADELKDL